MTRKAFMILLITACGDSDVRRTDPGVANSATTPSPESKDPARNGNPGVPGSPSSPEVAAPITTSPKPLLPEGFYPRAIQLPDATIIATVVAPQPGGRLGATVFESTDNGVSFDVVGRVDDARAQGGLCCGTLYRLPKPLGALPAGALLWAASLGGDTPNKPMSIGVWSSSDKGRNWSFLSTAVTGSVNRSGGGLWEPEFTQLDDGSLVCHWSDETDPAHSQKLVAIKTTNGTTWTNRRDTVSFPAQSRRPGMPGVRRLPNGTYVMSYEICGPDGCVARVRMSADGWNWGDPANGGLQPATLEGTHFRHAPTIAQDAHRLFMIGQLVFTGAGQIAPTTNGSLIFGNTEGGNGAWYPIRSPIPIPEANDNFCPNYSSTLLPLDSGRAVLEIASKWDGGKCRPYFARGLLGTGDDNGVVDGKEYALIGLTGGHCLDLENASGTPGADIRQWTCNGSAAQTFIAQRAANGTYTFKIKASNQCVAVAGGSTTAGANVEQRPCDGSSAQAWSFRNVGISHYVIARDGTDTCLDIANGSDAPGANVQQWTCNGLAPQIWKLVPR
jgi:hypothetical protein